MPEMWVIEKERLQDLIDTLVADGYEVIGPTLEQGGAITYDQLDDLNKIPAGYVDEQQGGHYRLTKLPPANGADKALFSYTVGPYSWKKFLFPPQQLLWQASRQETGFAIERNSRETPKYVFLGVRACELAAIRIQDLVFDNGDYIDSGYLGRRQASLIIAVNCTRAAGTCFCASMNSGPAVGEGFDLALTELVDAENHRFVIETGSDRGRALLDQIECRKAEPQEIEEASRRVAQAAESMVRQMPLDAAEILARNLEHTQWQDVAKRCLNCANCTMVCPTCFCSTVEDTTSLDGATAERWRRWDSCFTVDFSYIHGGPIRRDGAARYRQWITHKLSHWHDQFGTSGCVGCGRCITWCPVGIDITEEVAAIQASESTPSGDEK